MILKMDDDKKIKECRESPYMRGKKIIPLEPKKGAGIEDIIEGYNLCFGGRDVHDGAKLFKQMIDSGDTIWLGIAGAGIVGGMGGYVISLIKNGFVDAICSTGAQIYHDSHFAFDLPVVQGFSKVDDNALDRDGTTRIYDINIRLKETLVAQDEIFQKFAEGLERNIKRSTADYSYEFGKYILQKAKYPERSFVATAAQFGVPVFWDSESNHSIGMNNAALYLNGINIDPSPSRSLLEGAALVYSNPQLGFFELGGGGPKNWIQTLGPMISQILGIEFEGAERGIQITTAIERDGGLSGCTFGEAVTWGKYKDATKGLVQIWGDYTVIAPLLVHYAINSCRPRAHKRLMDKKEEFYQRLVSQIKS